MNNRFYAKLALSNIRKNAKAYVPYMLTGIGTIMMFYIMHAISENDGLSKMRGGQSLEVMLSFGSVVIGFFSAIFLFYTNSFLMKRRRKELGLYNILGMEKRHIARVLFFETIFIALICLTVGLIGGIILNRLMYLLLIKLVNVSVPLTFSAAVPSLIVTAFLFSAIFLAALFFNLIHIRLSNPIALLKSDQTGEKEPKTKWLLTIIGIAALGSGYFIALWVDSPITAMALFFVAVILVMIGTYALFTAGSIAILKLLRRSKKFYYQTKHFTAVSGMIHRMKRNAAGLANICILSTAVLVVLSTTVSLYIGREEALRIEYPRDIRIFSGSTQKTDSQVMLQYAEETAKAYSVSLQNEIHYEYMTFTVLQRENQLSGRFGGSYRDTDVRQLYVISEAEYNRLQQANGQQEPAVQLAKDEILLYAAKNAISGDTLAIGDLTYRIRQRLHTFPTEGITDTLLVDTYYLVVQDSAVIGQLFLEITDAIAPLDRMRLYIGFDLTGPSHRIKAFAETLQELIPQRFEENGARAETIYAARESSTSLYGGFFFLGLFLGLLFLMATVLIIYYKQISEGYEDKQRYEIMQQVGMDKQEIKRGIRSQILMVFFLPLLMAVIHIAFAFQVITKLLLLFGLTNTGLFLICTFVTILLFALIYAIVYSLTAKAYYRIVK